MGGFDASAVLSKKVLARLTDARVQGGADLIALAAKRRVRRAALTVSASGTPSRRPVHPSISQHPHDDGRLNLLAVDHPARHITRVGDEPLRMANRHELLGRIVRVLLGNAVDGIMATQDLLEDLLLLDALLKEANGPSLLDHKVVLGSLNRGGLAGAAWELDDPLTGPTPETCSAMHYDGAKMLLRVNLADRDSRRTIEACARWISELNACNLPSFLEPLVVDRDGTAWKMSRSPEKLAQLVGVASALGNSTGRLWLKLPYTENFAQVAGATTLPILLLGGEAQGDAAPLLREIEQGLQASPNVRGVLVGRNVLYPGDQDPLVVARAVDGIIHGGLGAQDAGRALTQPAPELVSLDRWIH